MSVNITTEPTGVFLLDYMKVTEPGPLIKILTPEDPFDFGYNKGSEYHAFGRSRDEDLQLLRDITKHANWRWQESRVHTLVVVFWHSNHAAPLIYERLVVNKDKEWKLSHDTELLTDLASTFEAFRVDRYDLGQREWKLRGIHDEIQVPRGGFVLCKGEDVVALRGFQAIVNALRRYSRA